MKPIDVAFDDYQSMLILFQSESDRGAAVLAGSYIENHLGLYLKSKMTDISISERIFSSEGCLSKFSQRIDFAQAFGYLSKTECDNLNLIKKIRNHFAHHPKEATFENKPISDWVKNLAASKTKIVMPDKTIDTLGNARFHYLISVGILIAISMKIN